MSRERTFDERIHELQCELSELVGAVAQRLASRVSSDDLAVVSDAHAFWVQRTVDGRVGLGINTDTYSGPLQFAQAEAQVWFLQNVPAVAQEFRVVPRWKAESDEVRAFAQIRRDLSKLVLELSTQLLQVAPEGATIRLPERRYLHVAQAEGVRLPAGEAEPAQLELRFRRGPYSVHVGMARLVDQMWFVSNYFQVTRHFVAAWKAAPFWLHEQKLLAQSAESASAAAVEPVSRAPSVTGIQYASQRGPRAARRMELDAVLLRYLATSTRLRLGEVRAEHRLNAQMVHDSLGRLYNAGLITAEVRTSPRGTLSYVHARMTESGRAAYSRLLQTNASRHLVRGQVSAGSSVPKSERANASSRPLQGANRSFDGGGASSENVAKEVPDVAPANASIEAGVPASSDVAPGNASIDAAVPASSDVAPGNASIDAGAPSSSDVAGSESSQPLDAQPAAMMTIRRSVNAVSLS